MGQLIDELVLESGANATSVAKARAAVDGHTPLVRALVDVGAMDEETLADLVARAAGTFVVALEHGEFDSRAVALVPPAIARRHLMLPIAPDPERDTIRVAFADPLDPDAVAEIRDRLPQDIEPVVATVGDLLDSIDRLHGPELREEATQRVDIPAERPRNAPSTLPIHRIEDEASLEQRHQALLLALVDRGVLTHADYIAAVRRLLGRAPRE